MATPPQVLDDAATPPGGALPAMATPPQILDATPPTDDEPDADALLAWPEICDLMNLQAPDAWRPRHVAVLAVTRLLAAGADAPVGGARWTATLKAALQVATRDRAAATALLRALAPAPDRDAFAEASAAARGAGDSSALVALRFPAKPKRAGDKRIPLRERMAAARGPEQLR